MQHQALVACSSTKRRRRQRRTEDTIGDASSWASLHEDLAGLIGRRVLAGDLLDYARFRAVCPGWRSGTECPRGRGISDPRFHPRRWMMLPEGHGLYPGHGKLRGYVRFVNLSSGAFVRARLPVFRDHCFLDSVDGILLLQRDADTAIRLLHPFTGDIVELPPLSTLLPHVLPAGNEYKEKEEAKYWRHLRNDLVTSVSVSADGVVTVMMFMRFLARVAFATSGDQQWRVSGWMLENFCFNPMQFRGKMYIIDQTSSFEARVLQVEPPHQEKDSASSWLPPPELIAKFPLKQGLCYLAECDSEILVAVSMLSRPPQFSVYRLADLIMERLVPMTSIGGNALFLHGRGTLSVHSKALPTIVADTIVFWFEKPYLLQYHLNTAACSQAADDVSPQSYFGPCPCSIFYHLFTCCYRSSWNKGHIIGQSERKTSWRVKGKFRHGVSNIFRHTSFGMVFAWVKNTCVSRKQGARFVDLSLYKIRGKSSLDIFGQPVVCPLPKK